MRRMLRWSVRWSKTNADGRHMIAFGARVGYWTCLKAPFAQVSFLFWHAEVWHGYPSNKQMQRDDP